jgi:hypothetical protein
MLNVCKYGHLCENLTFIGHLCEICSMCENMAICCLGSVSDALCVVSEALYSVSDGHYTKSSNCSVSEEEKRRCDVLVLFLTSSKHLSCHGFKSWCALFLVGEVGLNF